MRWTRALLVIGSAAAVGGLLLPNLRGTEGVEITWIWGTLAEWEQWMVAGAAGLGLVAAAGLPYERVIAALSGLMGAVALVLVALAWSDAASVASELIGPPVRAGWGYPVATAGLAIAAGVSLRLARGAAAGPDEAGGEPGEPRVLEVVIEPPDR